MARIDLLEQWRKIAVEFDKVVAQIGALENYGKQLKVELEKVDKELDAGDTVKEAVDETVETLEAQQTEG